jgi:DNA polymerase
LTVFHLDWETRATVDLRKTGVYPYAMHPETDIWLAAWAFDDEEPVLWHPGEPCPQRIIEHVMNNGEIRAHNAQFERIIWQYIASPRYLWPMPALEQFHDSAAEAAAMSLPRGLDMLTQVTGVKDQKDKDGYNLMLRMTRPRSKKNGVLVWWNEPEKLARLGAYCMADVRAEQAVEKVIRRLPPVEREIYLMDQRVNDRGFQIDVELVKAAKVVATEGIDRANAALDQLTDGEVLGVTKTNQIKAWLATKGVDAPSIAKDPLRDMLESDLAPEVRSVLELRQDAGKSSLAKLDKMLECICEDGRVRGSMLYHGASTGRWTGRLVQPHNYPRGLMPDRVNVEDFIPDVLAHRFDSIDLFTSPMDVVVSMLRSMIIAARGHDLIAADYSGIEARVLNWFAGQDDILSLFANGEDVYSYNAGRLPGAEPYVKGKKHPLRQTGKFQELGCGYGMGAETGVEQAKSTYQLIISLPEMKQIVKNYRDTHQEVKKFWKEADDSAIQAVANPGEVVTFGALKNLKFIKAGAYLYLILPSKRPLAYAAPQLVQRLAPWKEYVTAVEISAVNPVTKQWRRESMYGGLWVENIVQAASRDIMAEGMLRCEASSYPVVLSVHDEVVSEIPEGWGSLEEFQSKLAELPSWATGCPIATEGWRGKRYRK